MITIFALSKISELPTLLAYQEGVYTFKFIGDKTFTGASQTWTWKGVVDDAPLITGVRYATTVLISVNSLQDCIDNDQTFFYNINDGRLYVHWVDHQSDYSVGRVLSSIQESSVFGSNGIDRVARGYYNDNFYDPKLDKVSGFSLKTDPLKLGLVARQTSRVNLVNSDGNFDNISPVFSRGAICEVYAVNSNQTSFQQSNLVFKGYTKSLSVGKQLLSINIEEQRFFLNAPACPNVYEAHIDLDSKYEGKPKPVAFGDIRRGICVPLDSAGVDKEDVATITFQVADPAIGAIRAINGLYDSNGNAVTLGTINLTNCTVQYAKPAGADIDLDFFSWEGEGYSLGGLAYNNGLDIIRFCFNAFGNTPFLDSTFDITNWTDQTTANAQPVGISAQTTQGFTEAIIEPITVSLQGIVITKGDGLISFLSRNVDADIKSRFRYEELISSSVVNYETDSFVSSLIVEFSKNFKEDEGVFEEIFDFEEDIVKVYGLRTRGDISPIKTVLRDRSDAIDVGLEVMDTSKTPDLVFDFTVKMSSKTLQLNPFDLVDVDAGRYDFIDRKKVEVLSILPDYNKYQVRILGRILGDIDGDDVTTFVEGALYNTTLYDTIIYGGRVPE